MELEEITKSNTSKTTETPTNNDDLTNDPLGLEN